MDKLNGFYRNYIKTFAVGLAVVFGYVIQVASPEIEKQILVWLPNLPQAAAFFVSLLAPSGLIFGVVFAIGEWFIRCHLWRYIHPDLNFNGKWSSYTYFIHRHIARDGDHGEFSSFPSNYNITIKQDCINISIEPSTGKKAAKWRSIALTLTDKGKLEFCYEVTYDGDPKYPDEAVGYEEMDVTKSWAFGLPILMSGNFYHCAAGQKPVYSGNTIFVRSSHKNRVTLDDLPDYAANIIPGIHT